MKMVFDEPCNRVYRVLVGDGLNENDEFLLFAPAMEAAVKFARKVNPNREVQSIECLGQCLEVERVTK